MVYTIKEIIDIAIGLEEAGFEFYDECTHFFKDAIIKDTFSFLAREEMAHKELFQSFQPQQHTAGGIFNDEYFAYLRAIGGGFVFDRHAANMKETVKNIGTPMAAIRHAFIAEKESILLYSEMKRLYQDHDAAAEMLESIIGEERKHVLALYDLADKIRKT